MKTEPGYGLINQVLATSSVMGPSFDSVSETILSQCSTLFVMRMANDRDQAIIRSAETHVPEKVRNA